MTHKVLLRSLALTGCMLTVNGGVFTRGRMLELPPVELKSVMTANSEVALEIGEANLEAVEHDHILHVLRRSDLVISGPIGAAACLGLNRTTLKNKLRKLGISRPRQ